MKRNDSTEHRDRGRRRPPRRPRWRHTRLRARIREALSSLRFNLGFQRLPTYGKFHYPSEAFKKTHEEPSAQRTPDSTTARVFGWAAGVFCVVVLIALVAYGGRARQSMAYAERSAASPALQAIARYESGDLAAGRTLRARAREVAATGLAIQFLEEFVRQVDPSAAAGSISARATPVARLVASAGGCRGKRDMAGCLKLLGEALAKRPRAEVLYLLRADTLIAAGRGREALADASHLTDLGYDLAASDLRARAYTAMGRPREAAEELRGALAYAPESTYLHLALASALAQAGQTRAALQEIARTIGRDPRSASAYLSLGNVLVTNGGTKAGVRAFRRAVALNPNDPIAANNLAWTLAVLDKSPAEGLKYARQAYQIAPNHPNIVDTLAWTYHLLGQDDKALPLARKAVTLRPVLPNAVEHLATLLRAAGKSAEAEALTRRLAAPVKAGGHARGNDGIPARPELDMPPPEMLGGQ